MHRQAQRIELRQADQQQSARHDDRTEIRDRVEDAGEQSPDRGVLDLHPREPRPGDESHDRRGEQPHQQKALHLRVDVLQDLRRRPPPRRVRAGDLHDLPFDVMS